MWAERRGGRSSARLSEVTALVGVLSIAGVASGGLGGLLVTWGLIAVVTAPYSVVTGRVGWASVPGRKVAAVVLAGSLVAMGAAATLLPHRVDNRWRVEGVRWVV